MDGKPDRKSPVRLTLEEKWAIVSYCIEHRNIINHDGEILYRVQQAQTAKEVNQQKVVSREVTGHHVSDAIDTCKRICFLTKNMPFQTPQDSVNEDILKAEITTLKLKLGEQIKETANQASRVYALTRVIQGVKDSLAKT